MAANSEAPPSPTTPASDVQPDDGLSSFARACPAPPADGGRTTADVAAGKHGKKNAKEKKAEKAKAKSESLAAMAPLATTTSKNKKEIEALQKAREEIKKKNVRLPKKSRMPRRNSGDSC